MSYAPGAPAPVWSMPSKVLGPGAKLTLMSLWARADHVDQQLYEACTVWAKAREGEGMSEALVNRTAEATGQTPRAVRQHLTKLRKLDLVCTHGRVAILTPTCQHCRESVSLCHCGVDAKVSPTDADVFAADTQASTTDTFASLQLNPPAPPSPLTPGEGDAPAPATPQPSVIGAPVGETPDRAAAAANEHLGSKLEAHRARLKAEPPKASRVELTPAVHAAVVAARMSTSLEASVWVRCMLETLDDFGIGEGEHAAMVARVLAAWTSGERARPAKSQLWYRKHRDWQREAMGLGEVKRSGGMSGGIVAARPMPDWDAQAAERRAST